MAHRNARLTVRGRRLVVERVVVEGWSAATAAEVAGVWRATVYEWVARWRAAGDESVYDRSSRPARSPRRLDAAVEERILLARRRRRWGPHRISFSLGVPRSTAYKVLVRAGCERLANLDRPTGTPIRYVRDRPGELAHIDVKKLGQIPEGGGWRVHSRSGHHGSGQGYDKLHIATDDRTRRAFVQADPDERGETCAAFLARAIDWFATNGVTVERVMTDNALNSALSREFRDTLDAHNVRHLRTRPFRPQTNGKVERFNRTLVDEFSYTRLCTPNRACPDALPRLVAYYKMSRRHTEQTARNSQQRL